MGLLQPTLGYFEHFEMFVHLLHVECFVPFFPVHYGKSSTTAAAVQETTIVHLFQRAIFSFFFCLCRSVEWIELSNTQRGKLYLLQLNGPKQKACGYVTQINCSYIAEEVDARRPLTTGQKHEIEKTGHYNKKNCYTQSPKTILFCTKAKAE